MTVLTRLVSAIKRHGVGGFFPLAAKNVAYYAGSLLSGRLFRRAEEERSEFDDARGTDTERIREIGSLDVDPERARHAVRYQPSPVELATHIIRGLSVDWPRFTFLDFGAGKGRVLLIAGELPYLAVVGIEFSRELCDTARSNISRLPVDKRAASRIECVHADVTEYPLPTTPLVCYFYNPFDATLMKLVADRLLDSARTNPREIHVIYVHPEHRAVFDESGCWTATDEGSFHVVYRVSACQGEVASE